MSKEEELRRFALLGPFFVLGPQGFVTDGKGSRLFTVNIREARALASWAAADCAGRELDLKWWVILQAANFDTENGLLGNVERYQQVLAEVRRKNHEQ